MLTTRRIALTGLALGLALTAVAAEEPTGAPTIEATATIDGAMVTVTGTAARGNPGAEEVGGTVAAFQGAAAGDAIGLGLQGALIEHLDDGLRFTWDLASLPAPPAPEVIRYTWSFGIGQETFQLQAKTTNLVGTTMADDPAGHVTNAGASFQMRGNCADNFQGAPVSNCPHVTWLSGEFDTAAGAVIMDVPYGSHDAIQPGVVIESVETAAMSIAASGQVGVSNATTSAYINAWGKYYVDLVVFVGGDDADKDPEKVKVNTPVEWHEDGTFTATFELEDGEIPWARACTGFTCTAIPLA